MLEYILENKEWLFSGVALVIAKGFYNLLKSKNPWIFLLVGFSLMAFLVVSSQSDELSTKTVKRIAVILNGDLPYTQLIYEGFRQKTKDLLDKRGQTTFLCYSCGVNQAQVFINHASTATTQACRGSAPHHPAGQQSRCLLLRGR